MLVNWQSHIVLKITHTRPIIWPPYNHLLPCPSLQPYLLQVHSPSYWNRSPIKLIYTPCSTPRSSSKPQSLINLSALLASFPVRFSSSSFHYIRYLSSSSNLFYFVYNIIFLAYHVLYFNLLYDINMQSFLH